MTFGISFILREPGVHEYSIGHLGEDVIAVSAGIVLEIAPCPGA